MPKKSDSGIYSGRLLCDGHGNLLADEGSRKGDPVAYHEGSYVFLNKGEKSHNDRHHKQFAVVDATTDADNTGEGHHLTPFSDDPHYDPDTQNNTRLRFSPDKVAVTETGHTDAYTENGGDE